MKKIVFAIFLTFLLLENGESGVSKSLGNYNIFGGNDAEPDQFPYQVEIQQCSHILFWDTCDFFCGGSIIAPNWILTAGHCYEYGFTIRIVAGIFNRSKEDEFTQTIEVEETFVHEDYIGNANPNDIRLYKLKTPLQFTERVQPILLPEANYVTTGEVIASGWGQTGGNMFPIIPDVLQWQISNMPASEKCLELCNDIGHTSFNVSANVCTENPEANHGICKGDSGGPLVQNGTLIGISSWGFTPCGQKNAPSVFTRVSYYIDWIKARVPDL